MPLRKVGSWRLLAGLAVLGLLAGAAWFLAVEMESPEQAASDAAPPAVVPVTAEARSGFLFGAVTISATAARESQWAIAGPAALSGATVTHVEVGPGQELPPGGVVLRANGEPVFALPGSFTPYRDLRGGDTGDDVRQLQAGLAASGHPTGTDPSGRFGPGTKEALRDLYRAAGYEPPSTTAELEQQLSEIEQQFAVTTDAAEAAELRRRHEALVVQSGPRAVASQFLTVPTLPASVDTVAGVGQTIRVEENVLTLGSGPVVLAAVVPSQSVSTLVVGATGVVAQDVDGPVAVQVASIGATETAGEARVVMEVVDGGVAPGQAVVVRIDNPRAETGESLLVPLAAVVSRGGRTYVYEDEGSVFREREVVVLGEEGGTAAVSSVPDEDEPLTSGADVRISG